MLAPFFAGGQSYCVGLWVGHRYREPILQAAHAMWSLGGTVGPFIVARFLVELSHSTTNDFSSAYGDGCLTNGSLVTNCSNSGNIHF